MASKYTGKLLTNELRKLAVEVHDALPDGTMQTRAEALALEIWRRALGYLEKVKNDKGAEIEKRKPSEAMFINLVFERLDGKVANAEPEAEGRMSAADRVDDVAKSRLNALVGSLVSEASRKPPPKLPRGDDDA